MKGSIMHPLFIFPSPFVVHVALTILWRARGELHLDESAV